MEGCLGERADVGPHAGDLQLGMGQTPPPPSTGDDTEALPPGGIYVRWRDRLWQEQPDGSYLVWNDSTHEWETSTSQPPREGGPAATRECPTCGRRVKTTLRSCPYCETGFEQPVATPRPEREPKAKPKPRRRAVRLSSTGLLVGLILVAAIGGAAFLKRRADLCDNWKAGVAIYTEAAMEAEGLPRGLTEDQFRQLNEERFADSRPGGCG